MCVPGRFGPRNHRSRIRGTFRARIWIDPEFVGRFVQKPPSYRFEHGKFRGPIQKPRDVSCKTTRFKGGNRSRIRGTFRASRLDRFIWIDRVVSTRREPSYARIGPVGDASRERAVLIIRSEEADLLDVSCLSRRLERFPRWESLRSRICGTFGAGMVLA